MSAKILLLLCVLACQHDSVVSHTSPPPYCVYNNTVYKLSSGFKVDSCTLGYCESDGNVTIATTCCDELPCPNPVHDDDECCPRCPDDWVPTCIFEGQTYNVGTITTSNPCQFCDCPPTGGEPVCAWAECELCPDDQYGFPVPVPGTNLCCPPCNSGTYVTPFTPTPGHGCYYNGQLYGPGPVPSNNPCETCKCPPWGGEPDCFWTTCPPCADNEIYVSVPGQCCAICEVFTTTPDPTACYYNFSGQGYQDNLIPTGDPCLDCVCTPPGIKQCTEIACSPCADYEDVIWYPGKCCPGCKPRYTTMTPPMTPPSCYYDGQTYEPGPVSSTNRCETCECPSYGGDVECLAVPCGTCPSQIDDYTPPSECCPRCPIKQP
jgi:hypothetical protein